MSRFHIGETSYRKNSSLTTFLSEITINIWYNIFMWYSLYIVCIHVRNLHVKFSEIFTCFEPPTILYTINSMCWKSLCRIWNLHSFYVRSDNDYWKKIYSLLIVWQLKKSCIICAWSYFDAFLSMHLDYSN